MTTRNLVETLTVIAILGFLVANPFHLFESEVKAEPSPSPVAVKAPGSVDGPAIIHESVITFGTPVPTPRPVTVEQKIRAVFPEDPDTAVKIANCESHLNPKAVNKNKNGTFDYGVMQVNTVHGYSKEYLFNVDNNLEVSRKLYDHSGWNPWVCSRKIKGGDMNENQSNK